MGNRVFAFALAVACVAGCGSKGSEQCRRQAEFYEKKCIADYTQVILVDGKPQGTLMPEDEARTKCHASFDENLALCEAAPPEVRACDESEAKDHATWAADKHCQDVLTENYKRLHPGEK